MCSGASTSLGLGVDETDGSNDIDGGFSFLLFSSERENRVEWKEITSIEIHSTGQDWLNIKIARNVPPIVRLQGCNTEAK